MMLINNESERKERNIAAVILRLYLQNTKKKGRRQQNIVSIVCNKGQTYYIHGML